MTDKIWNQTRQIMVEVFHQPQIEIKETTTAKDIIGWDSMTHMILVARIEKQFNIEFNFEEASAMENVGQMIKLINLKVSK